MLHSVRRRRFPDAHTPRLIMQALADVACRWPMGAGLGRWRPADTHTPRLMRESIS